MNPEPSKTGNSIEETRADEARSRFLDSIGLGFGGQRESGEGNVPVEGSTGDHVPGRAPAGPGGVALSSGPDDLDLPGTAKAEVSSDDPEDDSGDVDCSGEEKDGGENSNSEGNGGEEILSLKCPGCDGELALPRMYLGVPGSCVWCKLPIVAAASGQDEVIRVFPIGAPQEKEESPSSDEKNAKVEAEEEAPAVEAGVPEVEQPNREEEKPETAAVVPAPKPKKENTVSVKVAGFSFHNETETEEKPEPSGDEIRPEDVKNPVETTGLEEQENMDDAEAFFGFSGIEEDSKAESSEEISKKGPETTNKVEELDDTEIFSGFGGFSSEEETEAVSEDTGTPAESFAEPEEKGEKSGEDVFGGFSGLSSGEETQVSLKEPGSSVSGIDQPDSNGEDDADDIFAGFAGFSSGEEPEVAGKETESPVDNKEEPSPADIEDTEDVFSGFSGISLDDVESEETPNGKETSDEKLSEPGKADEQMAGFESFSGFESEPEEDKPVDDEKDIPFGFGEWSGDAVAPEDEAPAPHSPGTEAVFSDIPSGFSGDAEPVKKAPDATSEQSAEEAGFAGGFEEAGPGKEKEEEPGIFGFGDLEDHKEPSGKAEEESVPAGFGSFLAESGPRETDQTPTADDSASMGFGSLWDMPGEEEPSPSESAPHPPEEGSSSPRSDAKQAEETEGIFSASEPSDGGPQFFGGFESPSQKEETPTGGQENSVGGSEETPTLPTGFDSMKEDEAPTSFSVFDAQPEASGPAASSNDAAGESSAWGQSPPLAFESGESSEEPASQEGSMFFPSGQDSSSPAEARTEQNTESPFSSSPSPQASPFGNSDSAPGFAGTAPGTQSPGVVGNMPAAETPKGPPPLADVAASEGSENPAPAPSSSKPQKEKKKSRKGLIVFLVILMGFVCGAALASFVLPMDQYVDKARLFLEAKFNLGGGSEPVMINQPVTAEQAPPTAVQPTTPPAPPGTGQPSSPPKVMPETPPAPPAN